MLLQMNKLLYNPFEPLTIDLLRELIVRRRYYIILQRLPWPGITAGTGFLATCYTDIEDAEEHQSHLVNYEGKLLDLQEQPQLDKLLELIADGSPYQIYLNTLKDKSWAKKMEKAYAEKVRSFIRSSGKLKVDKSAGVDIDFTLVYGHVTAVIHSGEQKLTVPFYDIIK
jgi:hypothetical protein